MAVLLIASRTARTLSQEIFFTSVSRIHFHWLLIKLAVAQSVEFACGLRATEFFYDVLMDGRQA
jgi:hypothetical protein